MRAQLTQISVSDHFWSARKRAEMESQKATLRRTKNTMMMPSPGSDRRSQCIIQEESHGVKGTAKTGVVVTTSSLEGLEKLAMLQENKGVIFDRGAHGRGDSTMERWVEGQKDGEGQSFSYEKLVVAPLQDGVSHCGVVSGPKAIRSACSRVAAGLPDSFQRPHGAILLNFITERVWKAGCNARAS